MTSILREKYILLWVTKVGDNGGGWNIESEGESYITERNVSGK